MMPLPKIKKIIPAEKYFKLCNGKIIKDIKELALAFETMTLEVYNHHANHERNDFSNWIKDIFGEKDLATELHLVHNSKDAEIVVLKFIVSKLYS
jgi:hypothetical protein